MPAPCFISSATPSQLKAIVILRLSDEDSRRTSPAASCHPTHVQHVAQAPRPELRRVMPPASSSHHEALAFTASAFVLSPPARPVQLKPIVILRLSDEDSRRTSPAASCHPTHVQHAAQASHPPSFPHLQLPQQKTQRVRVFFNLQIQAVFHPNAPTSCHTTTKSVGPIPSRPATAPPFSARATGPPAYPHRP